MIARLKRWFRLQQLRYLKYPDPAATLEWIEERQHFTPIVDDIFIRDPKETP